MRRLVLILVAGLFVFGACGGSDDGGLGYADTEGYYEEETPTSSYRAPVPVATAPRQKVCMQWETTYRYQPPPIRQFGQGVGQGTQVPTGQRCVRWSM